MPNPLLEAIALKKDFRVFNRMWFEWRKVVKDVSLNVFPGEIVCLLGPNGAGKSTSLKMICGVLKPDGGSVFLDGKEVTQWPMYKRCKSGLGYLAQENSLFRNLSVENNLIGVMQLLGYSKKECYDRCEQLIQIFDLEKLRHSKASGLSGGERRRLEVARALTKDPKLIILDEPFAGVDPKVVEKVQELIKSLREQLGIAILITDHNVQPVLDISDRGYVVADGTVIFQGPVQDLVVHPGVRAVYLGSSPTVVGGGIVGAAPVSSGVGASEPVVVGNESASSGTAGRNSAGGSAVRNESAEERGEGTEGATQSEVRGSESARASAAERNINEHSSTVLKDLCSVQSVETSPILDSGFVRSVPNYDIYIATPEVNAIQLPKESKSINPNIAKDLPFNADARESDESREYESESPSSSLLSDFRNSSREGKAGSSDPEGANRLQLSPHSINPRQGASSPDSNLAPEKTVQETRANPIKPARRKPL